MAKILNVVSITGTILVGLVGARNGGSWREVCNSSAEVWTITIMGTRYSPRFGQKRNSIADGGDPKCKISLDSMDVCIRKRERRARVFPWNEIGSWGVSRVDGPGNDPHRFPRYGVAPFQSKELVADATEK